MKRIYFIITCIGFIILSLGIYMIFQKNKGSKGVLPDASGYQYLKDLHAVEDFYPLTVHAIMKRSSYIQEKTEHDLAACLLQNPKKCTKKEVLYRLDQVLGYYTSFLGQLQLIAMVHPDKEVAKTAKEQQDILEKKSIDLFSMNRELYLFVKSYVQNGKDIASLLEEERYALSEIIADFEHAGLDKDDATREKITVLKKELAELSLQFETAIAQDTQTITATESDLVGIPADFISSLQKDDQGLYILKMDYPTQDMVLNHCAVEDTRKRFYITINNKAYPANESTLQLIIKKRHELANLLGYKNYAEYDLSNQMAKNPEVVWNLYKELVPGMQKKAEKEISLFLSDLPQGVTLTSHGKIDPWNIGYVMTQYKKKHYQFDELKMAEYFPMDQTISGLFDIYQKFFDITLEHVSVKNKWHEDVTVVKVMKNNQVFGYIFLDMHPRDNKYGHAAMFPGKETHLLLDATVYTGVCALVCNFTKPTADKPSLLTYNEVNTFFHEFGHALHGMLGTAHLLLYSGTNVKRDFVELPSQMLENWLEEKSILQNLGKHYKTGEKLPSEMIDKKLDLLKLNNGYFECRQSMLAQVSLALFEKAEHENMYDVYDYYAKKLSPFINHMPHNHMICSFGHLSGYGAKYYGYLWTRIFACDVFEEIKKEGLLNPVAGQKYLDCILSRGGSKDPNQLLVDYLHREPNQKAFLRHNRFEN